MVSSHSGGILYSYEMDKAHVSAWPLCRQPAGPEHPASSFFKNECFLKVICLSKRLLTSISADSTRFSIISIHCLLAGGSSLITVSSAMSVAGTVNTKMKKFTHYFIFR